MYEARRCVVQIIIENKQALILCHSTHSWSERVSILYNRCVYFLKAALDLLNLILRSCRSNYGLLRPESIEKLFLHMDCILEIKL